MAVWVLEINLALAAYSTRNAFAHIRHNLAPVCVNSQLTNDSWIITPTKNSGPPRPEFFVVRFEEEGAFTYSPEPR